MTQTVTFHAANGKILWCWTREQIDDPAKYVGTLPSQWIDPRDHAKVMHAIAVAAKGGSVGPVRYLLRAELYGRSWQVQTEWLPGVTGVPVVGISRTFSPIAELTEAERTLVKAIAGDSACNMALQGKKSTTLRSLKSRLAKKLQISASQLTAFCTAYADII